MTVFEVPGHIEEWKPVADTYGWYEVSDLGRVRSWVAPGPRVSFGRPRSRAEARILRPSVDAHGYRQWCHRLDGKEKRLSVHRTVCIAFHGAPPAETSEVRHLDGDRLNNRADNLAWGFASDNAQDRVRHGTTLTGERSPFAKLRRVDVADIREAERTLVRELAEKFDVSRGTIRRVIAGTTWTGVL